MRPNRRRRQSLVAGRSQFTDEDRARVFTTLAANEGNVKRTARDLGMAPSTVRKWRDQWQQDGPPEPELVEEALADFVADAERVRNKALGVIERKLDQTPETIKVSELNVTVGVLSDKIDRAKGLAQPRGDGAPGLVQADQVRELVVGAVQAMQQLAEAREAEIVEAELVPHRALPPAK